jgi:DNA-binding winged helix-turn-helix (wHTH) protein/TolB-like protein/Tfp pilus assembly protein PilF
MAGWAVFKRPSKAPQNGFKAGLKAVAPHTTYEFGPFRLDVSTRRLVRGDEVIPVTPKAFDILVALIERRDRVVVEKAELMKLVWPDSFVEEANLSQTIFVLRKTLGEDPEGNPYIETVPRRGYRFAAEVREVETTLASGVVSKRNWATAAAALLAFTIVAVVWAFRAREAVVPAEGGLTRIAVLPFENLTANRDDDWLASAFSDSLTSGLEGIDNLVTVSRDRIVEFYRQEKLREAAAIDATALRRISEKLRLRYYVHGSYLRIGDQLRVVARLVDLEEGTNDAQETVTDNFANLLRLEAELASRFSGRLERGRSANRTRHTPSLESHRATVLGRNEYAAGSYAAAREHLQRAVELDPNYGAAWALLSKTLSRLVAVSTYTSGSIAELQASALATGRKAVELDPDLADGHVALGLAYRWTNRFDAWREASEKSIELNPLLPEAWEHLANFYKSAPEACGKPRDAKRAEEYFHTAIEMDPLFAPAWVNFVHHLLWEGRLDQGLRIADEGLRHMPHHPGLRRARGAALLWLKRPAEAEQDVRMLSAQSVQDVWLLGSVALMRGDDTAAATLFDEVLRAMPGTVFELNAARSYFVGGRPDRALEHVDRAVRLDRACAAFVRETPALAPYLDLPQFRMRLAAWQQSGM